MRVEYALGGKAQGTCNATNNSPGYPVISVTEDGEFFIRLGRGIMKMGRSEMFLTLILSDAQIAGLATLGFPQAAKNVYLISRSYILYVATLPVLIRSSSDVDGASPQMFRLAPSAVAPVLRFPPPSQLSRHSPIFDSTGAV